MNVPDRIVQPVLPFLTLIGREIGEIFVHRLRDDIEVKPLGGLRLLKIVKRKAFSRRIGQPFIDGNAVALGLGNLLAQLVEEQFVDEMFRRATAEDFADAVINARIGLVVLAEHFEIDAERCPAHAEIRLPLQLHLAACDGQRGFNAVLIVERDGASLGIHALHRHVKHATGLRRDRQERAVGRLTLFAERRQHHLHDVVIALDSLEKHGVELAGLVIFRRAGEFIIEAESVEEAAQHGVVMVRKALVVATERVRNGGKRHLQIGFKGCLVRHIVRDFAHAVEIVGEADQACLDLVFGQDAKGVAHHRGTRHFAERADMRQAGRAITGLENHRFRQAGLCITLEDFLRFFKRPCFRFRSRRGQFRGQRDFGKAVRGHGLIL